MVPKDIEETPDCSKSDGSLIPDAEERDNASTPEQVQNEILLESTASEPNSAQLVLAEEGLNVLDQGTEQKRCIPFEEKKYKDRERLIFVQLLMIVEWFSDYGLCYLSNANRLCGYVGQPVPVDLGNAVQPVPAVLGNAVQPVPAVLGNAVQPVPAVLGNGTELVPALFGHDFFPLHFNNANFFANFLSSSLLPRTNVFEVSSQQRESLNLNEIAFSMLSNYRTGMMARLFPYNQVRLASFFNYPQSASQSPILLSSSGFEYIGDGISDRVRCSGCFVVKENLMFGDSIDGLHESNCCFVNTDGTQDFFGVALEELSVLWLSDFLNISSDPTSYVGSVTLDRRMLPTIRVSDQQEAGQDGREIVGTSANLQSVVEAFDHVDSFTDADVSLLSSLIPPQSAGLGHVPDNETVQASDQVQIGTINNENVVLNVPSLPSNRIRRHRVQRSPKHPEYLMCQTRLSTFLNVFATFCSVINLERFARAGFFYNAALKICCCFCCGLTLEDLTFFRDLSKEHARRCGSCLHLINMLGWPYIASVVQNDEETANGSTSRPPSTIPEGGTLVASSERDRFYDPTYGIKFRKKEKPAPDCSLQENSDRTNNVPEGNVGATAQDVACGYSGHELALVRRSARDVCCVCESNERRTVFLPCGHVVACQKCAGFFLKCTCCNQEIEFTVEV